MSSSVSRFVCFCTFTVLTGCASWDKKLTSPQEARVRIDSPEFRQAMGAVLGPPFGGGNRVVTLVNGNEIFPAMLRAIRSAKRSVTFETYVFEKGEVPQQFAEALAERARAGVKVHVIIDAHGGKKSKAYRAMWKEAGVDLALFKPAWINPFKYNNRTHRKLLVIDGRIGFIGGVGIADEWAGDARSPKEWHDTHYRMEGPAVVELQAAFMDDWLKIRGDLLQGADYFPTLAPAGGMQASAFYASPEHGSRNVEIMMNMAIASARRSLLIENAYFVPDTKTVKSLAEAARRGVRVRIIVPGPHMDQKKVARASRMRWGELLAAGVEIYEYQPTMAHTKLLIADGLFVSVGSANLDYRSLRINAEANLNILDARFATEQTRLFEKDLSQSKRVTVEEWRRRRAGDLMMSLFDLPVVPLL